MYLLFAILWEVLSSPLIIDDIRALLECQDSENRINAVVFLGRHMQKALLW